MEGGGFGRSPSMGSGQDVCLRTSFRGGDQRGLLSGLDGETGRDLGIRFFELNVEMSVSI